MSDGRPLRVAMLGLRAPWGTQGGVEQVVGQLAPRLVALGCEVTVYCRRRYNALGPGVHQGVRLVDVPTVYSKHLEAIVHTALAAPLATLGADVVHLHATGPSLFGFVPRLAGRATVVTVHGLDWQRQKWGPVASGVLRAGAWSAGAFPHRLIAVGKHLADHYQQRYGVEASWIPNGVPAIPRVPLEQSGVPDLQPGGYLLYVGRLVPEKGLDRLLRAVRAAALELPLVVAGGAGYAPGLVAELEALATPQVRLVGPRLGRQRDALLSHARAFVLPSRLEGFPIAALEALSAARPVLLSDIPPHRELLTGGGARAGWIVPDGDPGTEVDAWADALCQIERAPLAELRARGEAGRAHVAATYGWDAIAARTLAVYRAAVEDAGRTAAAAGV